MRRFSSGERSGLLERCEAKNSPLRVKRIIACSLSECAGNTDGNLSAFSLHFASYVGAIGGPENARIQDDCRHVVKDVRGGKLVTCQRPAISSVTSHQQP